MAAKKPAKRPAKKAAPKRKASKTEGTIRTTTGGIIDIWALNDNPLAGRGRDDDLMSFLFLRRGVGRPRAGRPERQTRGREQG